MFDPKQFAEDARGLASMLTAIAAQVDANRTVAGNDAFYETHGYVAMTQQIGKVMGSLAQVDVHD